VKEGPSGKGKERATTRTRSQLFRLFSLRRVIEEIKKRCSPSPLVIHQKLEHSMSIGDLEIDRVLLLGSVLVSRLDGDEVGSNVRVEHGKVELEIGQRDG